MSFKWIMKAALLSVALGFGLFTAAPARAEGLVAKASDLPAAERSALQAQIAAERKKDPRVFQALAELKGYRREHYQKLRNPIPQVSRELRSYGAAMLMPMLEALMFEAPALHGANEAERRALVEGMIGEVGRLRDPRARAALHAVFAKPVASYVLLATGRAMGRLCDSSSVERLRLGLGDPARRAPAIEGLGQCRTLEAAKILGAELDRSLAAEEALSLATAAGALGSSWAWAALGDGRAAEGLVAREQLAAALVRGFVRFAGEPRRAYQAALVMVEHPETRRIARANDAALDEAGKHELDRIVTTIEARRKK